MFFNYLKLAWRNLWKHKLLSFINAGSLAIGISAALVIFMIVHYDTSFDKSHQDADRIYRVVTESNSGGFNIKSAGVPFVMVQHASAELPEVEEAVFFFRNYDEVKVTIPGTAPKTFLGENKGIFADSSYFKMIRYQLLAGSLLPLREPYTVVLLQSTAARYFPGVSPEALVGREVVYNDSIHTRVAGVVADLKQPTDFGFHAFISMPTLSAINLLRPQQRTSWGNITSASQLFLKLRHGASPTKVGAQLSAMPPIRKNQAANERNQFILQPLEDLHFDSLYGIYESRVASRSTLLGMELVALFLLLLGCINFVNLQTARAGARAREIGVRKVMGSSQGKLITQFLGESLLFTLVAMVLSLLAVPALLQLFKGFIPDGVTLGLLLQPAALGFIGLLVLVISLFAGFYPAIVLSRFEPLLVLKKQVAGRAGRSWFRPVLTVAQFTIALVFIIATIIVSQQTRYGLTKEAGYRKDAILHATIAYSAKAADRKYFAEQLAQVPGIKTIGRSSQPPASTSSMNTEIAWYEGKEEKKAMVQIKYADTHYADIYQLQFVAGRNLQPSDTMREIVINESMAREAGFTRPAEAVGATMKLWDQQVPVAGVVRDFDAQSIKAGARPLVICSEASTYYSYDLLLEPGGAAVWRPAIQQITALAETTFPDKQFDIKFFDDEVAAFYKYEQELSALLSWSMALMVLLSCLGLLGLSIHATTQRTREVGIRKVMGASVAGIVAMFTKDVIKLIAIALLIAAPVAWYAMHTWLQGYAFRVPIQWWVFAAAGAGAILVGLLTVSVHSLKAALMNPVRSLRTE